MRLGRGNLKMKVELSLDGAMSNKLIQLKFYDYKS
jgi:hypothetical protein